MKNNRINTIFLVLFNLSLIAGFSYILFTGVLEKVFIKNNKLLPTESYTISISRTIPSINDFPRQSATARSQGKSSADRQPNFTVPTMNLESFYVSRSNSRGAVAPRGLSSSSGRINIIDTEDELSRTGIGGNLAIYSGARKGGSRTSEGNNYLNVTNMPFTDGISTLPRSSVPRTPGDIILIDPMSDPLEENRIPVGDGFVILLLFAAAFVGKVYIESKF